MTDSMQPSDMKLADLVAELRERLRHLASGPVRDPGSARSPGALGPVGRLSLAIRLLAEALRTRYANPGWKRPGRPAQS